jgi:hypothetical protein
MRGNNLPGTALVLCLILAGCDLLSNKPEIDVEKAIDDAVRIANAPVLNVEVDEGGMGTASPRGTLSGIKQGVPFQLNYQTGGNYPFYGWQARLEGSEDLIASWTPEGASGADKITWVPRNITGTEVQVTIHIHPAEKIIIGPIGADAPEINVEVVVTGRGAVTGGNLTGSPIKLGVPFALNFSSATEYGFIGWRAYRDNIAPGNMLGDADVVFSDRQSLNPEVRVNINPGSGKVVVEAYTERLAAVKPVGLGILSANKIPPGNVGFNGPPPQHIQLQFDKPMDPRSFIFPDRTASKEENSLDGEGNRIVRFNNIVLTGMTEHNPYDEMPLGAYFNPPALSVDGKIVTLWVKEKEEWYQPYIDDIYFPPFFGYNLRVTMTLDASVRDRSGLPFERDYVLNLEYSRAAEMPTYIQSVTAGAVNGLDNDLMSQSDYSGQNYMIIKAGSSGSFPHTFSFDPQTHHVFTGQGEWVYIAMLINYDVSLPRAFMILESDDSGSTWSYTGTEAEIVNDPNITIPLTEKFDNLLSSNGRAKDKVYPVMVIKYRLKDWAYSSGDNKTVYLRCLPLNIGTPKEMSPKTYGYGTLPTPDGNPGRFTIHYEIP